MSRPRTQLNNRRSQPSSLRWGWRAWASMLVTLMLVILQHSWFATAQAQTAPQILNQAAYSYTDPATGNRFSTNSNALNQPSQAPQALPPGQVTGCAGEILPNYQGFSISLNEADASGLGLGALLALTQTELPDSPNNNIPLGTRPNIQNSNPFFLTTSDQGAYNFLLDANRGQLDVGRIYILVVNPANNSTFSQRRLRIAITGRTGNQVTYTASSLDGQPISFGAPETSINGTLQINSAAQASLVLPALSLNLSICQAQGVQIVKSGDRAAAEPGDTVIYRLSVRNLSSANLDNLELTDTLPLGFGFIENSVRAELNGNAVAITTTRNGRTLTFRPEGLQLSSGSFSQNATLNLAYAATLSPDAIRGSGQNSASVTGRRIDNLLAVRDGPVFHRLRIEDGILSICGTIIGRVFVDKNFDGEQQPGEPGVPNAVILMDDGNRITTDANGLYSIANVISGYRTGVLDLTSLPGYTLAPNLYFIERNSQSRLVHLEPGGLVRMNFAVTPTFKEEGS